MMQTNISRQKLQGNGLVLFQVTLNVALNEDYSDGELYFGPMRSEESSHRIGYSHQPGQGLLHRAQQFHGALPITSGIRWVWLDDTKLSNFFSLHFPISYNL